MLRQGRSCIAPQTVFQLTWCFRKTFLLTHKFGTSWAIEMSADREEWSALPIGATTATRTRSGTSVIRRSSVPPRAWVGPTTNWSNNNCQQPTDYPFYYFYYYSIIIIIFYYFPNSKQLEGIFNKGFRKVLHIYLPLTSVWRHTSSFYSSDHRNNFTYDNLIQLSWNFRKGWIANFNYVKWVFLVSDYHMLSFNTIERVCWTWTSYQL